MKKINLILLLLILSVTAFCANLKITVLDVGQGLSIVTQTPENKIMVFDMGTSSMRDNSNAAKSVGIPYLKSIGANKIDTLILSHPHTDHYLGLPLLTKSINITNFLYNGYRHDSKTYKSIWNNLRKQNTNINKTKAGDIFKLDSKTTCYVYNPQVPSPKNFDENERSLAIKISYGTTNIFLAGDCDGAAEESMVDDYRGHLRSNVLVVGHHGSPTGCSDSFLREIKPSLAVISCGINNPYHHPSNNTLQRLMKIGARIHRTDQSGGIIIISDGKNIKTQVIKKYIPKKYF